MKIISLFFCSVVLVSGIPQQKVYLVPELRSDVAVNAGESNPISYEYQLLPSSEYAVSSYQPDDSSVLDFVLSPVTAIVSIGSTALSAAHWMIVNCGLVLLGMSIVIGLCGLTSYCNITIENPFSRGLPSVPYLDDIHYYFSEAYNKYHEMQSDK